MSDVAERVKKIVVEHLGVEPDKVVDSANFIDDLGADSLDTVELVMAFEEEFGVEIPDVSGESLRQQVTNGRSGGAPSVVMISLCEREGRRSVRPSLRCGLGADAVTAEHRRGGIWRG